MFPNYTSKSKVRMNFKLKKLISIGAVDRDSNVEIC